MRSCQNATRWSSRVAHALTGILICGDYGGKLYHNGRPAHPLYRCGECTRAIDANGAEEQVAVAFLRSLSTKHARQALDAPKSLYSNGDDAAEAALLDKEIARLDARIDGLIDAKVDAP
jgi:hypothetical protein